ncbi:MAG: ATP phosphoribosyltransferase regulatory subunit [Leptospiraceae bacterium]|nr:ATP phosphoribosyltransferase regulatory subunit [Leptospiraceae bacterium]MCB1304970.1 ATP phosphoribosyltransferase regulatory subunit [Leptospiraceae bacterium]
MEKFRSWIPHGFDYLSPDEIKILRQLQAKSRDCFEKEGFNEIIPPGIDYAGAFAITGRHSVPDRIFEFRDSAGENLAVRSDLTVQVIKAVSSGRAGTSIPADLYYVQPVFVDAGQGSGAAREIYQAGVEMIGESNGRSIGQRVQRLIELARKVMDALQSGARFLYGDARFLELLFKDIDTNLRRELSEAFYRKDRRKIQELCEAGSVEKGKAEILSEIPHIFGDHACLQELRALCAKEPGLLSLLDEAEQVQNVVFDFSLVRELSYYDGPVIEAFLPGHNDRILSGGIYDGLASQFTGRSLPASGFAVHLSELMSLLSKKVVGHPK